MIALVNSVDRFWVRFCRICGEGKKFSSESDLVAHIDSDHSFNQFYQDDNKPVREVTPEPPAEEQPQHDQGVKILAKRPSADLEDGEISKEEEEKVTTTTDHPSNPAFPTSNHQLESSILLSPIVHQIPVAMGSRDGAGDTSSKRIIRMVTDEDDEGERQRRVSRGNDSSSPSPLPPPATSKPFGQASAQLFASSIVGLSQQAVKETKEVMEQDNKLMAELKEMQKNKNLSEYKKKVKDSKAKQDKVPVGKQIRKRRRSSSSSSNTSTSSTCSDDMRNPKKNTNKAVKKATPMTGSQREATSKAVDGQTLIDLTKPNKKGSRGKVRGRTRSSSSSGSSITVVSVQSSRGRTQRKKQKTATSTPLIYHQ